MLKEAKVENKSYSATNLSVLAYANNFTLWHYVTKEHPKETVFGPQYFTKAGDMLRVGDLIIINTFDMNTNAWVVGNDADGVRIE